MMRPMGKPRRMTTQEIVARADDLAAWFEAGEFDVVREIRPGDPGWDEYLATVERSG